jgi:hypothetical protein
VVGKYQDRHKRVRHQRIGAADSCTPGKDSLRPHPHPATRDDFGLMPSATNFIDEGAPKFCEQLELKAGILFD